MVPAQSLRRARTERITQPCCRAKILDSMNRGHAPAWHIHVQETRRTGYEAGKLRLVGVHASATNINAETTNRKPIRDRSLNSYPYACHAFAICPFQLFIGVGFTIRLRARDLDKQVSGPILHNNNGIKSQVVWSKRMLLLQRMVGYMTRSIERAFGVGGPVATTVQRNRGPKGVNEKCTSFSVFSYISAAAVIVRHIQLSDLIRDVRI
jgi:hypothetical protein